MMQSITAKKWTFNEWTFNELVRERRGLSPLRFICIEMFDVDI